MIEFDEESHTYFVDGETVPSVTQILKAEGVVDDRWFTEFGRWRGSAVHRAIHLAAENRLDRRSLDPRIKPYLKAAESFQKTTKFFPAMVEQQVWEEAFRYCGTLDAVGYFASANPCEPHILVDYKTYDPQPWTALQLAAYGRALDPKAVFRRIAVCLASDGTYRLKEFVLTEYVADVNTFLAMTVSHRWKLEHCD
ncbi:MAG: hypothetical protein ACREF8_02885 [Chthoniobacterales bacterium]